MKEAMDRSIVCGAGFAELGKEEMMDYDGSGFLSSLVSVFVSVVSKDDVDVKVNAPYTKVNVSVKDGFVRVIAPFTNLLIRW
ncbi:MAG: hypothetical protein FWF71_06395 [Actinomycetia bacterium]|nr:hypothetical protein [Actinomycetes bacterium]